MSNPSLSELTDDELNSQIKQLQTSLSSLTVKPPLEKSEGEKSRERLLDHVKKAGFHIAYEASASAIGQKGGALAGLPFAGVTFGLAPLIGAGIGGAIGGVAGYEAANLQTGEESTVMGRMRAAGFGAIPFSGEARLAAGAAGQLARVTGREMVESGTRMGAYNAGVVLASAEAAGQLDKVTPLDVIAPAVVGAAAGAGARYVGGSKQESSIPGAGGKYVDASKQKSGIPEVIYSGEYRAAGPSAEAASEAIKKSQNVLRDQDFMLWQNLGGINDPRVTNPSAATRLLQGISADSNAVNSIIQTTNTTRAGEISRNLIGVKTEAPFTIDVFANRAKELKTVYPEIKQLGSKAETAVNYAELARDKMRKAWRVWREAREMNKGSSPELLEDAIIANRLYENAHTDLKSIVTAASIRNPAAKDLVERLDQTRVGLGQLEVIKSAAIPGANIIDASVLGQLVKDAPSLLTDDLALIGRIYNTQPRSFIGAVPNVEQKSKILPAMMAAGGTTAAILSHLTGKSPIQSGGAAVAGATAAYAASSAASNLLTGKGGPISNAIQQSLSKPQYSTNVPSNLSLFLAKSGGPAGSNVQSFIDRYRQEQQGLSPSR